MNRKLIDKADALLGKEKGTFFKDPGGKISVCLVYPNTYYVGMSNLGFQGIYSLLNRRDDAVCERAFLPDPSDIHEYARTSTPIFSLESKKALADFDIVAFSLSFENDYPNMARILDMAKVPLRSSERNDFHPLVIAGGVCVSFNPEPVAPVFDIIFIGEAEETVGEFISAYKAAGRKEDILNAAMKIPGVYVPSAYDIVYKEDGAISSRIAHKGAPDKIEKSVVKDIARNPFNSAVITSETEFSNMYLVEVMRGCPWNCRFCVAGNFFGPVRTKTIETVSREIEEGKKKAKKIGIIGPSLSDYGAIDEVLRIEGVKFSITSLRAGSRSSELVSHIKGHKSVSIAPEAGTERLRRVIDKRVTEEDVIRTSRMMFEAGVQTLRLYFMIGLPTETEEDIDGIIQLAGKVRAIDKTRSIVLSVSTFVPKPFTPFQWLPMDDLDSVKRKIKKLKKSLEKDGIKVFHDVPKHAHMQGLFSLGDRRVFSVIERMVGEDDYRKACKDAGIDSDFYIFRNKKTDEILPWDFIEINISGELMKKEFVKAISI